MIPETGGSRGATVPHEWPDELCDIVMKGGITSGVVYPRAVHALAGRYRLKSVGGTSAGAIAAAAAAAAEYGRADDGYRRLEKLPGWIGSDGNLAHLFQPARRTRRLFRVLIAGVGRWPVLTVPLAFVRSFWLAMLLGALPGAALAAMTAMTARDAHTTLLTVAGIAGGVLLALGGAVLLGLAHALRATRRVVANGFGICSGMPGAGARGRPALTPWLTWLIDDLAGRETEDDSPPLTFGDLWNGPEAAPADARAAKPWLRLEMMTTNFTNRRAERLPSASREFYFCPVEMRRLFPERVVRHLEAHSPRVEGDDRDACERRVRHRLMEPLLQMPPPEQLPVVVATRMSLSFPVLLSAVPLRRIDWDDADNRAARNHWSAWVRANRGQFEAVFGDRTRWAETAKGQPCISAKRCWFSDGGVSSNFPIHFFDAPLPQHPTFGINLRAYPPGQTWSPDEAENVWMVAAPGSGMTEAWYGFEQGRGWLWDKHLVTFLSGLMRTMQNRVDDAQLRVPGYRERVVHVNMDDDEGGMNLSMSSETIDRLTSRGQAAAELLVKAYLDRPVDSPRVTWDAHRWVRLRSALPAIAGLLEAFAEGWNDRSEGRATYADLVSRRIGDPPTTYAWRNQTQQGLGLDVSDELAALAATIAAAGAAIPAADLGDDAPRPAPAARLMPQDLAADGDHPIP
jgi:predicted acylesterase/phospholipase RssA